MRYWYFIVEVYVGGVRKLREGDVVKSKSAYFPLMKVIGRYEYEFGKKSEIMIHSPVQINGDHYHKHRYRLGSAHV